jgi:hypothetical protein
MEVDMRSLAAIIAISSLLLLCNCASNYTQTVEKNEINANNFPSAPTIPHNELYDIPERIFRFTSAQYLGFRFSLNNEEEKLHEAAVWHAILYTNDGEITSWYSKTRDQVYGKVRVVYSYPVSDGHCRVYQSFITVNGTGKTGVNKACKQNGIKWAFLE